MMSGASARLRAGVAVAFLAMVAVFASGCGSDDSSSSSSGTSGASGTSGTSASGISNAFGSNCARCHGPSGLGQAQYPKLPGNKDEAGFIAIVRSGKGDMPAFSTSNISDADLKADYAWMTTKR